MWAKGRKVTVIVCLAVSAVALAQKQVSSSHIARPALATERGSFSFRGLPVAVGETSPGHDIVVRNRGDSPMRGLNAVTHGDFVITASSCTQTLEPAGSGKDACSISVAFRPTTMGRTSGDLTVQAAGVRAQVVPLDAGTPIDFPTVQPGATALEWVELPSGTTAISGTVTGPFTIALQTSYVYGSINGVAFDSSASSDGVCATGVTPCGVYLGVEFLGTSSLGETTGTVTLSNGLTYSLSANVLGPGLLLTPTSLDGGSIPVGSTSPSTPLTASITNFGSTVITLGQPGVSGPFTVTNGCGSSLAAGATCTISVFFAPTAIGAASGELQVASSVGNLDASLTGTGLDNPADV
ncbi:MAG TPA: choice-of-anchor D domain-containing protein, partial [Terracidiphilus sp.]